MKTSGPRPLWETAYHIDPGVIRRLRRARRVALFLDYDGTLTPIAATREAAVPGAGTVRLLRALVAHRDLCVAIVTGRSLAHIPRSIRTCGADLAVDHGVRILSRHGEWIHPALEDMNPVVRRLHAAVEARLGHIPGIRIERKRWSVDLHYRQVHRRHVPEIRATMKDVMQPYAGVLRLTRGKKVMEARPAIAWSKGHAILTLLEREEYQGAFPVFIGDDRTDEDGFVALASRGLTVRVGRSRKTAARYRVRTVGEALEFLEWVGAHRRGGVHAAPR